MSGKKKPVIAMTGVKSSQVHSIGHDTASNTLAVRFASGGTYHYHGVTAEQFAAMQKAESVGKYLGQHIKPKHKVTKIEA